MARLDPDTIYPSTHTLMAGDYHESMTSIAEITLEFGTDAYIALNGMWLDEEVSGTNECREAFAEASSAPTS
ncbi:hypothetical protein D3261_03485 [Halococcus sp. IIIV-5B]|nr:hypothetical protein D3261_03485 [Halococcus sp. IIIV-5B]